MKRLAIAALVLMASLSIVGCTVAVTDTDGHETVASGKVTFWTDQETGVEYVLVQSGHGAGICPRYNSDGSIKVMDE